MKIRDSWEGDAFDPECPTRVILDRVGDKWTVLIIEILDGGSAHEQAITAAKTLNETMSRDAQHNALTALYETV